MTNTSVDVPLKGWPNNSNDHTKYSSVLAERDYLTVPQHYNITERFLGIVTAGKSVTLPVGSVATKPVEDGSRSMPREYAAVDLAMDVSGSMDGLVVFSYDMVIPLWLDPFRLAGRTCILDVVYMQTPVKDPRMQWDFQYGDVLMEFGRFFSEHTVVVADWGNFGGARTLVMKVVGRLLRDTAGKITVDYSCKGTSASVLALDQSLKYQMLFSLRFQVVDRQVARIDPSVTTSVGRRDRKRNK